MKGSLRSLLVLAVAAAAPAQERRAIAGVVLDAAGKPVASATVLLAGETMPGWSGAADFLETTTDADGRFRARVLECVEYDAWAVGPEHSDGSWLATPRFRGATPGPRLELRASSTLRPRTLTLAGLDAWADAAPFRARLWHVGSGYTRDLDVDAAGKAAVPRQWAAGGAQVELLDGRGQTIAVLNVEGEAWAAAVPAPRTLEVLVTDDAGKPLAGVTVERWFRLGERLEPLGHRVRRMRTLLGTSDAQGVVPCRIAPSHDSHGHGTLGHLEVRARKAGFADGYAGCIGRHVISSLEPGAADGEPPRLGVRMQPAHGFAGQVLLAPGRPLAGCALRLCTRDEIKGDGVGFLMDNERLAHTGADGAFTLDGMGADTRFTAMLLGAEALPSIVGEQRLARAFPPGQPFVLVASAESAPQLRVDLSQLVRIALQVVDERDGPASGALVVLQAETGQPFYLTENDPRFRVDPAGRATVLLSRGTWFLCVTDGTRGHWQRVEVGERDADLRLQLLPWARLRGEVVDGDGKPVAGARMVPQSYGPGERHVDYLHVLLLQRWIPDVLTNAEGRFELPFLPDTRVEYTVRMMLGERASEPFVLRDAGGPLSITLR